MTPLCKRRSKNSNAVKHFVLKNCKEADFFYKNREIVRIIVRLIMSAKSNQNELLIM